MQVSTVQLSKVTFKNIKGTAATPETVTLKCSKKVPCLDVTLSQIQVTAPGTANVTCANAKGTADGSLKHPCF
jgi:galacturan 1,4-alpha-galacturonidase